MELRPIGEGAEYDQLQVIPKFEEIIRELTNNPGQWQHDLTKENKVCFYFVNFCLTPSKHVSIVRQDRAILLYALVKGWNLNVGKIVE